MEGVELVNLLRKELRKRIENGEKAPKYIQGSSVLGFHIPNLEKSSRAKRGNNGNRYERLLLDNSISTWIYFR